MSIRITFLDVGHGDCTVISQSTSAVIVDVRNKRRLEKWLDSHGIKVIECLYFTHGHKDHFPSLTECVTFISDWLNRENAQLLQLCLPTEVGLTDIEALSEAQKLRLQSDLDKLELWETNKKIKIWIGQNSEPRAYGDITIHVLHPSLVSFMIRNVKRPSNLNETSIILRVDYNAFKVLLLADTEQSGITTLLKRYGGSNLKSQVVKIPHHGAWPSNGDELRRLLQLTDPEIAVLSVGSTNQHGHVVPELFKVLLDLKNDPSYRLEEFVCTEVTRTCVWDAIKRQSNRYEKLDQKMLCAGDISIIAEPSGAWIREDSVKHAEVVDKIDYAACRGKLTF